MSSEMMEKGPVASRPNFLTVLCILTFIGSGWGILSNLNSYRHPTLPSEAVSIMLDSAQTQVRKDSLDDRGAAMVDKVISGAREMADPFKIQENALYNLVACLLTLGGGFLMFQQRKVGFWVYLLGTAVSILAPFVVFGTSNLIGIMLGGGTALLGILFCVLYAVNLKHMS